MEKLDPIALGLPHRAPFVFLDAITDLVPGERATAEKTFHADEPMFAGHFPGDPIVPGVILTEALAQLAGIVIGDNGAKRSLLSAIRSMKFPAAARPGESITLEARLSGALGPLIQAEVKATVAGRDVASGVVVLSVAT